mmetsp:Transcript_39430/g.59267  ORF Transcript_39430/g.59267 Transcript_39430/m.59267 type:complete len:204 (-) Transcript_39430:512-1123(-)
MAGELHEKYEIKILMRNLLAGVKAVAVAMYVTIQGVMHREKTMMLLLHLLLRGMKRRLLREITMILMMMMMATMTTTKKSQRKTTLMRFDVPLPLLQVLLLGPLIGIISAVTTMMQVISCQLYFQDTQHLIVLILHRRQIVKLILYRQTTWQLLGAKRKILLLQPILKLQTLKADLNAHLMAVQEKVGSLWHQQHSQMNSRLI